MMKDVRPCVDEATAMSHDTTAVATRTSRWMAAMRRLFGRHGTREAYRPERHYMRGPGPKSRDKTRDRTSTS